MEILSLACRLFTPETSAPGLPRNCWYSVISALIILYYSLRSLETDSKCCRLKTARMLQQHLSACDTVPPKHQWSRHCWGSWYQPPAIIFRGSDVCNLVLLVVVIFVVVVAGIVFVVVALLLLLCWHWYWWYWSTFIYYITYSKCRLADINPRNPLATKEPPETKSHVFATSATAPCAHWITTSASAIAGGEQENCKRSFLALAETSTSCRLFFDVFWPIRQ